MNYYDNKLFDCKYIIKLMNQNESVGKSLNKFKYLHWLIVEIIKIVVNVD